MPPFKTFRFTGWSGGLYASANTFDQPQGTVPRISNLMFAERGGLNTVDGSHVVVRPGPPPAPLAFVSSGAVTPSQPPAPVVVGTTQSAFNSTGSTGFGTPIVPLDITINIPSGIIPGDVLIAVIYVEGYAFGVGAHMNPIDAVPGWTVFTYNALSPASGSVNVLYRVVTGTEGASVTFQFSGPVQNYGGFSMNGFMTAVRGANTSTPINVFGGVAGFPSSGSVTANSVTTTVTNSLLLISMTQGGALATPANVPNTTVQVNAQNPGGQPIVQNLAAWSKAFAGPGATGNFVSASGWPLPPVPGMATIIALGASVPSAGQLMGFPITANGVITPSPIIQGAATNLAAPQGCFKDLNGKLWTADFSAGFDGAIIGYQNPQNDGGNTAPDTYIQGPLNSLLANPYDVCVGLSGKIYVANFNQPGTGQILIYASGVNGDVAPLSQIGGSNTGLVHPIAVAVDSSENVYVLDNGVNSIKVWHAGNTGNVAPDQTIVGALTQITNPLAIRVDPNNLVWITCGATSAPTPAFLLQFTTANNGNVAPTTRIDSTALQPALGFAGPTGLAFDLAANIYVSVLGNKNVLVFPVGSSGTVNNPTVISGFPNGPWGIGITQ